MNVQHPNLPKADNGILKIDAMIEHSLKIFRGVAANRYKESKPPRKMISALNKKDYIAPANDKWRHDDSQSDDEEPKLKKMMEDKFGRKKIKIFSNSSEGDDDDGNDEGGDGGDVGASAAGAHGTISAGGDEEDSDSDDNEPEPGYEFYLDERGVKKVRRIRQEEDADYVPSDTEAERLKKKQTVVRRKKKSRKYIGASSVQPTVSQQESVHEAEMNPNFGLTAGEASAMVSSPLRLTEPPPVVSLTVETPTVTPQAEHAHTMASTIRATTSQHSSERRQRKFSEMQPDEKVVFLFSQLQAAAGQIDRQSAFMNVTRNDVIKQQVEIKTLKSTVERQQAEIERQQAEVEHLKAENERLKAADDIRERQLVQMRAADNARGIEMNRLKERSTEVQRVADSLKAKHDV
ncbi:transcription initiation factor IIF subunit alpha-like [Helianthus annuus]|uniref:transcription initiation factor IIF subunit alpha-like n=1 Tax=Helianthus annuus TaxID=4232 RepID=UPI000B8F11DF|nr:transcription initiation factor IIF subunit alpha-like [Helianthus annuus]